MSDNSKTRTNDLWIIQHFLMHNVFVISYSCFEKFGGNQSKPEFAVDLRGGSVEWASKEKSSKKHVIEVKYE